MRVTSRVTCNDNELLLLECWTVVRKGRDQKMMMMMKVIHEWMVIIMLLSVMCYNVLLNCKNDSINEFGHKVS